jgi:diaminopimelate epimerase
LEKASKPFDFSMKFYNPDGTSGMFCGNGGRCIAKFAQDLGIIAEQATFLAPDGLHTAELKAESIILSMQNPSSITHYDDGYFLNTGAEHFVVFVDDLSAINLIEQGKKIRYDKRFALGTNANFVEETSSHNIKIRTYERGVEGETLACGTGITACSIAYSIKKNLDGHISIVAQAEGGRLRVSFHRQEGLITDVFLEGAVEKVFDGSIAITKNDY